MMCVSVLYVGKKDPIYKKQVEKARADPKSPFVAFQRIFPQTKKRYPKGYRFLAAE